MGEILSILIVVGIFILSGLQKLKEQRDLKQKLDFEDREEERLGKRRPDYEETVRTAQPRGAQPRRTQAELPQDMDDVIRQLMGQPAKSAPQRPAVEEDVEEGEWEPVPPPIRREIPRQTQQPRQPTRQPARQPAATQRHRQSSTPTGHAQARQRTERPSEADIERRKKEVQWRREMEQRKLLQQQQELGRQVRGAAD